MSHPLPHLIPAALLLAFAAPAHSQSARTQASFDCAKASSAREHAVCASPKLAAGDKTISSAYAALRARLSSAAADSIRDDQRQWLLWLDRVCPDRGRGIDHAETISDCLEAQYNDRLKQLTFEPRNPAGPVYTRAEFDFKPAATRERGDGPADAPAFGTGVFSWPQIDNPTPAQAAWNRAVYEASIRSLQDPRLNLPLTFASVVDAQGSLSASTTVLAASPTLILSSVTSFQFGYGSAHPSSGGKFHSWLIPQSRELKPEDVFSDPARAAAELAPRVISILRANPDYGKMLFDDASVRKGVATELANVSAWQPTRSGLTINFDQYEVGPYVIGTPSTELPWTTLKPYLNPAFNPAGLPALPPQPR